MTNIRDALRQGVEALNQAKLEQASLEAAVILAHVLQKSRSYLIAFGERTLTLAEYQTYCQALERRQTHYPLAYILGEKEFWSLALWVNEHTLIPRAETEQLVETVLATLPKEQPLALLELGTGSGAIAIALAHERPNWHITATDVNPEALALAKKNAARHSLDNILFLHSDWFMNIPPTRFAAILSNPPYIAKDCPAIAPDVKQFEPPLALFSAEQGLADIKKIATQSSDFLAPGGLLIFEHGHRQGEAVKKILTAQKFKEITGLFDLAGLPRLTLAKAGLC
jgi:release factor glutamine methyltransferase